MSLAVPGNGSFAVTTEDANQDVADGICRSYDCPFQNFTPRSQGAGSPSIWLPMLSPLPVLSETGARRVVRLGVCPALRAWGVGGCLGRPGEGSLVARVDRRCASNASSESLWHGWSSRSAHARESGLRNPGRLGPGPINGSASPDTSHTHPRSCWTRS